MAIAGRGRGPLARCLSRCEAAIGCFKHGRRDDIDSMPVGQVIAIDSAREFRRIADQMEKWLYVPFAQVKAIDS